MPVPSSGAAVHHHVHLSRTNLHGICLGEGTSAIRQPDYLTDAIIHAIHGYMQKIQILFPDPLMEAVRNLARIEDRPVSEIVRRAVDRDVEQRSSILRRGPLAVSAFPVFDGGKVLVSATKMKSLIYGDE
jgi:hypothetical protein